MKLLIQNYTFNASSKQITFLDYTTIKLERILLITNTTNNTIIYNFANPAQGGTVSGNILTLLYNTTIMSNTDALQIFYEDTNIQATDATLQLLLANASNSDTSIQLLKKIVKLLEPLATQDSSQRQRVAVETMPIVAVNTVNTITSLGGPDYRYQYIDQARATYANSVRNNITF